MNRINRIRKLEDKIQPLAERVTILSPTDEEWDEYHTGSKSLPNGLYDFDFTNLSTDKLKEIIKEYENGQEKPFKEAGKSKRVFTSQFAKLSDSELEQALKRYDIEE